MASIKLRVRMDLKLFKDGELVLRTTLWKKSQVRARVQVTKRSEWDTGRLRVWYNVKEDYWNEFEFKSLSELDKNLTIDTEIDLVKAFV